MRSAAAQAFARLPYALLLKAAYALRQPISLTTSDPGIIGIIGHGTKVANLGDIGIDLSFRINLSLPKGARLGDGLRQSSDALLKADVTAAIANMSSTDAEALLDAFRKAAGPEKAPFIWTVTDGDMIDFAKNMLATLDAVSCVHRRLLVGMGRDVCKRFHEFSRTTCVEIFPDSGSEDAVAWGSEAYFKVAFRKQVILTMLATSGLTSVSVFTDPDIAFLQDPVTALIAAAGEHDIVLSPNNYLDKNPESALDVAEEYERRGMEGITMGSKGRRADINTGLLYLRSSLVVSDLMLRTLLIFKSEGGTHGHYQQFALVAALKRVPEANLSVAPGDVFVNGNVFWGHRKLLDPSRVVSVHANWMASALKRTCLQTAGLWKASGDLGKEAKWLEDVATMDANGKTVQSCSAGDGTAAVAGRQAGNATPEEAKPDGSGGVPAGRSSADIPTDVPVPAAAADVAKLGGMPPEDAAMLVGGIKKTVGDDKRAFLVTVTDGGMVDMAQNMLRSLDAVPSRAPRLVVCVGSGLCGYFDAFDFTTCVEVYKDSKSEDEVSWGSPEYFQVVLRKHTILTVIATSKLVSASIYADPDIVFLDSPVGQFRKYSKHYDIVFSPNNFLEKDARNCDEVAAVYEKQGIESMLIGSRQRRVDINTGLFVMRGNSRVASLMTEALKIFKSEEGHHGHFQQYSLVRAMKASSDVKVRAAPGQFFVNGNVFWGHRSLLSMDKVVSIHANWMESGLKRKCLKAAGLWFGPAGAPQNFTWRDPGDTTEMDEKAKTVRGCAIPAGSQPQGNPSGAAREGGETGGEEGSRLSVTADLGGMSESDVSALLAAAGKAASAGAKDLPTILTVVDAGSVDQAQNMLRSLDAIPSPIPRLVAGLGKLVCSGLQTSDRTICVDVCQEGPSSPGALQRHAVLTAVIVSGLLGGPLIYAEPDVVFLEAPEKQLRAHAAGYDILFAADQFLRRGATACDEAAEEYRSKGLQALTLGQGGLHPDIDAGLFYMEQPSALADTMLLALVAMKEQKDKERPLTQQSALASALGESAGLRVGVAPGDVFVNGNVFWGHRAVIDTSKVASVRASWIAPSDKRRCLESAGLWIDEAAVASFSWSDKGDRGTLDERGAMIVNCSAR